MSETIGFRKDWRRVRLEEICNIASGATPSSGVSAYWNGDITWITPTDLGKLDWPFWIEGSQRRLSKAGVDSCPVELVSAGSVVMSSRAPIGHLGLAKVPLCMNQGCKAFVPSASVDSGFLFFALRYAMPRLQALGSGATFAEVSKTQVAGFEIAVPRLGEQRKIAANLYGQLAAAARARAAVEAQLDGALRIEVALLEEFFPADQNTHEQPLEDMLAAPLRTGLSKPMLPASEFRCLTLSSVRNGALDFSASKPVDVTKAEAEANRVKPGAFYVVRGNGNRELVGRGALAPAGTETPMTFPDLLFELVPDARRLLPDFLRWAWNAPGVRRQIEAKAQTSAGIYKINQGNLRQIRVPVPPLDEQVRLVHELQDRSAATRRLIGALQEKRDALDSLPARLLASAFGAAPTHHGQEN